MKRGYQLPTTFVMILTLVIGAFAVSLLPMSVNDAAATAPPCSRINTQYPHKSTRDPVIRVHGETDCRNTAATYVEVTTELYRNGNFVTSGTATGSQNEPKRAVAAADKSCPTSGKFQGKSFHYAVISGKVYSGFSIGRELSLSC